MTKFKQQCLGFWALLILLSLSACKQSPEPLQLTQQQWAQHLQLPSVQQASQLSLTWSDKVTQRELQWHDSSRGREVPALLYLPAGAAAAKLPLIVFSHGLGGSRDRYAYLGLYWASQGFASLHLQHIGSDRQIWRGSRLTLPFRLMNAAGEEEALARVADVRFGLDQLLQSEFAALIDPNKLIMAGHSYGANTTMLVLGAKAEPHQPDLRDARFSAGMLISAPPFYNDKPLSAVLAAIAVPTLHITNTMDEIEVPGYHSTPEERIDIYQAMPGPEKVLAVFYGGNHNIFSGRRQRPELALQDKVLKAATQSLSAAFVSQITGERPRAVAQWQQQHQPLLAQFEQYATLGSVDTARQALN